MIKHHIMVGAAYVLWAAAARSAGTMRRQAGVGNPTPPERRSA